MGQKLDKAAKIGSSIAGAVSLWDRVTSWWSKRRETKAEAKRLRDVQRRIEDDLDMQRISDEMNRAAGTAPCPNPGCRRPKWHEGSHGERP